MTKESGMAGLPQTESLITPEELIVDLIRFRRTWYEQHRKETLYANGEVFRIPDLEMTPALTTLFQTPELWVMIDGVRYVPDAAVKALLVRRDGAPIDKSRPSQDRFTSAIAMRRRVLEGHYSIRPLSAWEKQHHQYWDERYVKAFFATLQYEIRYFSRTVYRIQETADAQKLLGSATDTLRETVNLAMTSTDSSYSEFRKSMGITRKTLRTEFPRG